MARVPKLTLSLAGSRRRLDPPASERENRAIAACIGALMNANGLPLEGDYWSPWSTSTDVVMARRIGESFWMLYAIDLHEVRLLAVTRREPATMGIPSSRM